MSSTGPRSRRTFLSNSPFAFAILQDLSAVRCALPRRYAAVIGVSDCVLPLVVAPGFAGRAQSFATSLVRISAHPAALEPASVLSAHFWLKTCASDMVFVWNAAPSLSQIFWVNSTPNVSASSSPTLAFHLACALPNFSRIKGLKVFLFCASARQASINRLVSSSKVSFCPKRVPPEVGQTRAPPGASGISLPPALASPRLPRFHKRQGGEGRS